MIHSHSVASGPDTIELYWSQPKFPPERYQLMYVCTIKPSCMLSHDANHFVMTKTLNLSSDTTYVTISDLHPSSNCILILLAVYNPASIDSGIAIAGSTLDGDAKYIKSGQHCFNL